MFEDLLGRRRGARTRRAPPERIRVKTSRQPSRWTCATQCSARAGDLRQPACAVPECKGSGARPGSRPQTCPQCGGSGEILMAASSARLVRAARERAPSANPAPDAAARAPSRDHAPEGEDSPGVETGSRVRLLDRADPASAEGNPAICTCASRSGSTRRARAGRDLLLDLPITAAEALAGRRSPRRPSRGR